MRVSLVLLNLCACFASKLIMSDGTIKGAWTIPFRQFGTGFSQVAPRAKIVVADGFLFLIQNKKIDPKYVDGGYLNKLGRDFYCDPKEYLQALWKMNVAQVTAMVAGKIVFASSYAYVTCALNFRPDKQNWAYIQGFADMGAVGYVMFGGANNFHGVYFAAASVVSIPVECADVQRYVGLFIVGLGNPPYKNGTAEWEAELNMGPFLEATDKTFGNIWAILLAILCLCNVVFGGLTAKLLMQRKTNIFFVVIVVWEAFIASPWRFFENLFFFPGVSDRKSVV